MGSFRRDLKIARIVCALAVASLGAACGRTPAQRLADNNDGRDWAAYGATYGEQHYSPLAQINDQDVGKLRLAWYMDLPPGNSVTQPLAIDGVLYFASGYSVMHAVDATSGKLLWTYDPDVAKASDGNFPNGWGSRGIAWWDGKVYTATNDGRLIAIDAKSGKPLWSVQTLEPRTGFYITGAPRAFDGKIIVGNSGSDFDDDCKVPNCPVARGYVTAYDAATGKQLWRFYTVPGDPAKGFENKAMEAAAKTWAGRWWEKGGGGTVWNAMTYDADFDTILIATGNGAPHSNIDRSEGKGDNLYISSVVALDAKTGAYKWHYQVNPAESWDFDDGMDMQLADLNIDGKLRKVIVHAPKNGFVYVIDRQTGKLISAQRFAPVTWASRIDLTNGRPVENPSLRDPHAAPFIMSPTAWGAHNWMPSAFSPKTGLLYIPTVYSGQLMGGAPGGAAHKGQVADGIHGPQNNEDLVPTEQHTDLTAWNPLTQMPVWRVNTVGPTHGGVIATGGNLVFQGQVDGSFNAYDARTGKLLWSFASQAPVLAPPATYMADGKQYVTVLTGLSTSSSVLGHMMDRFNIRYTQPRRVLTFVLDGGAALPAAQPIAPLVFADDPTFDAKAPGAQEGAGVYVRYCLACHGRDLAAAGAAPDLRTSAVPQSAMAFSQVVRDGVLNEGGMPRFKALDDQTLNALRQFIRAQTHQARSGVATAPSGTRPL